MRITSRDSGRRRRGVAAVEFAFVLPLLLLLLVGIWEMGRILHVQTLLNGAARDGARLGAQANIVNPTGAYTQIKFDTGTPNIDAGVRAYLKANGITDLNGLVIQFQFVESMTGNTDTSTTTADPYKGMKNQRFRVRLSLPYANVRWTTLSIINPTTLTAEAYWQCMVDDPFVVDKTLPGWSP